MKGLFFLGYRKRDRNLDNHPDIYIYIHIQMHLDMRSYACRHKTMDEIPTGTTEG